MKSRSLRHSLVTLLMLWALVFLGHSWEAGLKMDAMTYSAVAKRILSSGDWTTLHYTPSAYREFYQHPPGAIWLQALVFKFLGASDFTARLVPAFCGLGTLLSVFALGTLLSGEWMGFLAALVLLTSGRYIKFATDFFLDGPLAFFMTAGALFFLLGFRRGGLIPFLAFGACVAAGFLVKGVVVLALPASTFLYLLFNRASGRIWLKWALANLFGIVLLLPWIFLADGRKFLELYWQQSVSQRLGESDLSAHLAPARALLHTWWPWLPVLLWGMARLPRDSRVLLPALQSVIIFSAFSYTGNYLDHYLVPFFPMAALVVAEPLSMTWVRFSQPVMRGVRILTVLLAVGLAVLPIPFHLPRGEPLRALVMRLQAECHGQNEILITGKAMERWMALAVTLWLTPGDATSIDAPSGEARPDQLLVIRQDEPVPHVWKKVPGLSNGGLQALEPAGSASLCGPR